MLKREGAQVRSGNHLAHHVIVRRWFAGDAGHREGVEGPQRGRVHRLTETQHHLGRRIDSDVRGSRRNRRVADEAGRVVHAQDEGRLQARSASKHHPTLWCDHINDHVGDHRTILATDIHHLSTNSILRNHIAELGGRCTVSHRESQLRNSISIGDHRIVNHGRGADEHLEITKNRRRVLIEEETVVRIPGQRTTCTQGTHDIRGSLVVARRTIARKREGLQRSITQELNLSHRGIVQSRHAQGHVGRVQDDAGRKAHGIDRQRRVRDLGVDGRNRRADDDSRRVVLAHAVTVTVGKVAVVRIGNNASFKRCLRGVSSADLHQVLVQLTGKLIDHVSA